MAHSLGNAFVLRCVARFGIKISLSGMKKLLDQYISENYQEVRAYTLYFLQRTKSTMEVDTVINNSYLHVLGIQESHKDIDIVKSYLLNTIKYQILWTTSKSHRDDAITAIDGPHNEVEDEQDLKDKVREDIQYSHQKAIIEIYRAKIEDNVHRIVFEAYIDKGYTTARAMAKYFGITVTSAHYLIKEIKQNLNSLQYRYDTIATI
jgi:hypothetical protein